MIYFQKHNPDRALTRKEVRSARKAKVYPDIDFVIEWDQRKDLGALDLSEAKHAKLTCQQAKQWIEVALITEDISQEDLAYWYHVALFHSFGDAVWFTYTSEKFIQRLGDSTFDGVELPQLPVRLQEGA